MKPEKVVSSKKVFEGQALTVRVDTIDKVSGERVTREIVEHNDCIAAVVLDGKGNVLLVRQFRRAAGKPLLEIPAGVVEKGEKLEDCVRREMQEEIGYLPGKISRLGGVYAAPGYCTEFMNLFLCQDLKASRLIAEDTDEIEVVTVPLSQIQDMIEKDEICDGKSVAGLLSVLSTLKS